MLLAVDSDESYFATGLQAPLSLAQNFLVPNFESIEWKYAWMCLFMGNRRNC